MLYVYTQRNILQQFYLDNEKCLLPVNWRLWASKRNDTLSLYYQYCRKPVVF